MTSPLVVMVAVEALGAAFLTFLVTEAEAADGLVKRIEGMNKGKE